MNDKNELNINPVREMTDLENAVFNEGERLVPGVSHAMDELERHASSYTIFKNIIQRKMKNIKKPVTILDLGCGCGWGSSFLANLPGVHVTGLDIGRDAITYAKKHHKRKNVEYHYGDITEFVDHMPTYDFIVSRNMIEHVPNGIALFKKLKWSGMLLVDVPYMEKPGNPHHIIHEVNEATFNDYDNPMFLFQDMEGNAYDKLPDDESLFINILFVLCQKENDFSLKDLTFPIKAWKPKFDYDYYDQSLEVGKWTWFGLRDRPLRIHP